MEITVQNSIKDFVKKQVGDEWYRYFQTPLKEEHFNNIINHLAVMKSSNQSFEPRMDLLFRAFTMCPEQRFKVLILGQDPYPQKGVATGIAFANRQYTDEISPSLKIIHDEMKASGLIGLGDETCDLTHWAAQGVLLLNTALTVATNTPSSHQSLWRPFMEMLIYAITSNRDCVVALFGGVAKQLSNAIANHCAIVTCAHPAADTYGDKKMFRGSNIFNKINNELDRKELGKIIW